MSLINQMLQELDARGAAPAAGGVLQGQIRPAPPSRRHFPAGPVIAGATLLLVSAAAWFWLARPVSPEPVVSKVNRGGPAAAVVTAAPAPLVPESPAPEARQMPVAGKAQALKFETTLVGTPAPASASVPAQTPAAVAGAGRTPTLAPAAIAGTATVAPSPSPGATAAGPAAVALPVTPVLPANGPATSGPDSGPAAVVTQSQRPEQPVPVLTKQVRALSFRQQAENDYRKAASLIQQGRKDAAIGLLEQALSTDEQHAAARQTLAALLLELQRSKDAELLLREGVRLDPAQTGMATILARLQLEHGTLEDALETLQRSLPHAAGRADYHAFLAALLQRAGRHEEAVAHYSQALRQAPDNGVWWMGQGISLQEQKRTKEAAEAYARARASNSLSPELKAFVDEKLNSL